MLVTIQKQGGRAAKGLMLKGPKILKCLKGATRVLKSAQLVSAVKVWMGCANGMHSVVGYLPDVNKQFKVLRSMIL